MKSWLICVVFISMLVMSQEVGAQTNHLKFPNPCDLPSPPPSCSSKVKDHAPTNPYDRGCSAIHRCRGD
ncbi:hypothetical protein CSA_017684 [Cucumis sativus]|uniref:Uncharacterized protein n=2 Tax=Cucumis sativus TaxID=3659 RepID=A0A0A0M0X3_CUCSA|nr:hypothetical protein CSA_017684 [Cucumis sativus]